MASIAFEGQQSDERILYTIVPHPFAKYIAIGKLVLLVTFFYLVLLLISTVAPELAMMIRTIGILLGLLVLLAGIWWNTTVFAKSRAYITDRRIMRVEVVSPFFQTKRALFWNEALKAKGYAPNLLYRMLNIGTLQVLPLMADQEDVAVSNTYYFEDLANYIDKILFTFKNKPGDIASIKPFVPKPKGKRD